MKHELYLVLTDYLNKEIEYTKAHIQEIRARPDAPLNGRYKSWQFHTRRGQRLGRFICCDEEKAYLICDALDHQDDMSRAVRVLEGEEYRTRVKKRKRCCRK